LISAIPAAGSNSFLRCTGLSVNTTSQSRANLGLQQVSTVRRAIALSDYGVRMDLGLTIFQGDVADQRKQFDLADAGRLTFAGCELQAQGCSGSGHQESTAREIRARAGLVPV
jgi:hypothetical protein